MPTLTDLDPSLETAFDTCDDDVPPDFWERLWEEWEPFSGDVD